MKRTRMQRVRTWALVALAVPFAFLSATGEPGFAAPTGIAPAAKVAPPPASGGDGGQAYSEGEQALEQIATPFRALRTFQAKFVQTQQWVGMDDAAVFRGVLSISRPNRFRIEYTDPKGHVQVSDGTQVWTYVPENEQVLLLPLREEQSRGDVLTRILEESRPDPVLERGTLDGKPVRILTLIPPAGLDLDHVRLWTAEGSSAILQYELTETGGNRTTYRLEEIRENPDLDEKLFRFTAPPGVPVVEVGAP